MLIERKKVQTVKVATPFLPEVSMFPHYRLMPSESGKQTYSLFFHISPQHFLILDGGIRRYPALAKLALMTETAPYPIYEVEK